MSTTLPTLAKGATTCWTECPVPTPHHKEKKAKDFKLTFYSLEVLPRETIRNIARITGSEHPPKGPSRWEMSGRANSIGSAKT